MIERRPHPSIPLSKELERAILTWYLTGKTQAEVARMMRVTEYNVSRVVFQAMQDGRLKSDLTTYRPSGRIKPHDYSKASEYTLQFKGAEFEDTRPCYLRALGAEHPYRYRL